MSDFRQGITKPTRDLGSNRNEDIQRVPDDAEEGLTINSQRPHRWPRLLEDDMFGNVLLTAVTPVTGFTEIFAKENEQWLAFASQRTAPL